MRPRSITIHVAAGSRQVKREAAAHQPAPTMTTSGRFSELHHPDVLENELQRRQAGDVSDVERGARLRRRRARRVARAKLAAGNRANSREVNPRPRGRRSRHRRSSESMSSEMWSASLQCASRFRPRAACRSTMRGRGRDQRDAHLVQELHLVPVVVAAPEQSPPRIDLSSSRPRRSAQPSTNGYGARIVQVGMRVNVEDAQSSVSRRCCAINVGYRGVVAAQHDRQGAHWRLSISAATASTFAPMSPSTKVSRHRPGR